MKIVLLTYFHGSFFIPLLPPCGGFFPCRKLFHHFFHGRELFRTDRCSHNAPSTSNIYPEYCEPGNNTASTRGIYCGNTASIILYDIRTPAPPPQKKSNFLQLLPLVGASVKIYGFCKEMGLELYPSSIVCTRWSMYTYVRIIYTFILRVW